MARRTEQQETIDQLIETIKNDNLSGRRVVDSDEFLRWCADAVLNTQGEGATLEDIEASITDGPGDQGMDMMYVDHDNQAVYLFQSKFANKANTIKHDELDSFTKLPERLMDGSALRDLTNERIKNAAFEFRRCIDERQYELKLLFVTTKRATQPIQESLRRWNDDPLALGFQSTVDHNLQIFDASELLKVRDVASRQTDITMSVEQAFQHKNRPRDSNGFLSCLVPASELMHAFDEYRFTIFELNPRGPLGNVKVNKSIRDTLRSEFDRTNFHFLNNGLTAVCEGFQLDNRESTVRIQNLQIVNGCQTTWTLWDHYRSNGVDSLEGVYVILKLIEAPRTVDLARQVSLSSNSQSQMRDWDFLFDLDIQKRLQNEFESFGVFYELKRGEQKYIAEQTGSKTNIQNAAQAAWAILGFPGEARDRLREIPQTAFREAPDTPYKTVFFGDISARHLQLPIELVKKVAIRWKQDNETDQETGQINRKFHAVWLIGVLILKAMDVKEYRLLTPSQLEQITINIESWFKDAYDLATIAIDDTVYLLTHGDDDRPAVTSLRQAFRSSKYYDRYLNSLNRRLEREQTDYLADLKAKLIS